MRIEERIQIQRNLQDSEERWRSLTETSPDHILTLDTSLNIQFANLAFSGATVEELIGTPLYQYAEKKEKQDEIKAIFETVLRTGEHAAYETVYHIPEGGTIYYESRVAPRKPEGSKEIVGMTVSSRNITERKQAEEALRDSEEKYRNVVRNAIEAICVIQDGIFKYFNPEAVKLFGYSEEELEQLPVDKTIYPEDKEQVISKRLKRERGELESGNYSHRIVTKDGRIRWVEIKAVTITWSGRLAILVFLTEITDRKQAEERLQEAHNRLEKEVEERTVDYKKAKEEAELANQLKSEFLANISHELRNPMHQILSYSKYGVDKIDKPKAKLWHYFNQTRKAAERLMVLLNDLLDLSKMESGRVDYKKETNNVFQIVCEAISELKPAIEEKNLFLKMADPLISTKVTCDYYKVGQVMRNIISNAIKYTDEGEKIEIVLTMGDLIDKKSATPSIQVSVCDQGVGIPEDELISVFDKFTQSSKTKTGAGGTGLGLAICQEIIKAHRGKIWAENNSEGGATFSFVLPYEQKTA